MPITINGLTDSRSGRIAPTLDEFSVSTSGTHVAPANRDGYTNFTLGSFLTSFDGQVGSSQSVDGSFTLTLDGFSAGLRESPPVAYGSVDFFVDADSSFDTYTSSPTTQEQQWMRDNYSRMQTYTTYFDSRLSWYPDAWFYKDLYAIKPAWAIYTSNPEWVLKDAGGNELYIPWGCSGGTCPQFAADIGNPAFQTWWIGEATTALANGYKGIWVDDVNLEWRVSDGNGDFVNPIDPRTGSAMTLANYRLYFAQFVERIRAEFQSVELVHNSLWFAEPLNSSVLRQIASCDYVNIERGVTDSGITGGSGTYGFETFMAFIDRLHTLGKNVIMDDVNSITDADWNYELAFYFLIKENGDLLGADGDRSRMSPNNLDAIYSTDLGEATSGRYLWNDLYRRDYEDGFVLVNPPGAVTVNQSLGDTYTDLSGSDITSVSMTAGSGKVLVPQVVQNDAEADWEDRSTASGVFYRHNFTYKDLAETQTIASTSDLLDSAAQYVNAPLIELEQTTKKTGSGSLKLAYNANDTDNTSTIGFSFDGIGVSSKNTSKHEFYCQFLLRPDSVYRTFDFGNGFGGKLAIFQSHDRSFERSEIVIYRTTKPGGRFIGGYRFKDNGTTESFYNRDDTLSEFVATPFINRNNDDYLAESGSERWNALQRRHGLTLYSTADADDPDIQHVPDLAENDWTVVEVYIKQVADTANDQSIVKLWMADYGQPPELVMGAMDAELAPIGQQDGSAYPADIYSGFQLSLYSNPTSPTENWPSVDTFVLYDELIASDEPIPFPGNQPLPYTGSAVPSGYPWGLTGDVPAVPGWASALNLNTWTAVSTNTGQDVEDVWSGDGNTGPSSVIDAWGGAAYVRNFGEYGSILHWGGGHQDYYGNEVYSFDLKTKTWSRLNDHSPINGGTSYTNGILPDGTPRTTHTYHNLVSDGDLFYTTRRDISNTGGDVTYQLSVFNPNTLTWVNYTDAASPGLVSGDPSVYDTTRNVIWSFRTDSLYLYKLDVTTGVWTTYAEPTGAYSDGPAVYVSDKDCILLRTPQGLLGFDPDSPTSEKVTVSASGSAPSTTNQGDMMHWSDNLDAVIYYVEQSNLLYKLTPPAGDWKTGTWVWSQISMSGSTGSHTSNGTFGKFQVIEWGSTTIVTVVGLWSGNYYAARIN